MVGTFLGVNARVLVSFFCVVGAFMGLGSRVWVLGFRCLFVLGDGFCFSAIFLDCR